MLFLIYCAIFSRQFSYALLVQDEIKTRFPGLNFEPNFKSYAGYLDAQNKQGTSEWRMFYWLTESKSQPLDDPLVVYFSGGPGCASVGEAFEEMGPFYVNYDGNSLYENVYAWNAKANVLYLDSPIGIGFSYSTNDSTFNKASDDLAAQQNYDSLQDFFIRIGPEYRNRSFYLTGSSYSGVYQPMLAAKIVDGINAGTFPNLNFKGFAIGNGYLDIYDLNNALVLWNAYHAKISLSDWERMKDVCYIDGVGRKFDMDTYEFHRFLKTTDNLGWSSNGSECGNMIMQLQDLPENEGFNAYEYYEECWGFESGKVVKVKDLKHGTFIRKVFNMRTPNTDTSINTAELLNIDSSDNQLGYPCWHDYALYRYMNGADVLKAFNIAQDWIARNSTWSECSALKDPSGGDYIAHASMEPYFEHIFQNWHKELNILLYNGDVDTMCNYLGDARFAKRVSEKAGLKEQPRNRWSFRDKTAGWHQRYSNSKITLDVLTVKGAGHFVPNDRAGASVQMISNFVHFVTPSYSQAVVDPRPTPIAFGMTNFASLRAPIFCYFILTLVL